MKERHLYAAVLAVLTLLATSWLSVTFSQEEIPKPPPPPVPTSETELEEVPLPQLPKGEGRAQPPLPEEIPTPSTTIHDGEAIFALRSSTSHFFYGTVVSVHDGDTVNVKVGGWEQNTREQYPEVAKIRLAGVDAPELKQPFGQEAGKLLAWTVSGRPIWVKWAEKDRYGRYVGLIFPKISEKVEFSSTLGSINALMLESGMVWHYKAYDRSEFFEDTEKIARDAGIGLWSQENPQPPWEYRSNLRGSTRKSPRSYDRE